MATTDTTVDSLFEYRLVTMEQRGFTAEEALALCNAQKLVSSKSANGRVSFYEVPISWHDVAKLQNAGATNEQVLRILT